MTAYPSPTEYAAAVQDPQRAFRAPNLRRATFAMDPLLGIPLPSSGSAARSFWPKRKLPFWPEDQVAMPRLTHQHPKYRLHRASGQAVVTLDGKDRYLGPFGTTESTTFGLPTR